MSDSDIVKVGGPRITVDLLLWRRYGPIGQRLLEETLELNPGLATLGPVLPLGTLVKLPPKPDPQDVPDRELISLFD